jgi:electron transfer flavoprotein beta subunit
VNIVVLLKQVRDPNSPQTSLRIAEDQQSLLPPAGSMPILNGYDANAVEESVRLRERCGGTVTAVSVGPESAKEVLRRAIAMGADTALHIEGASGLSGDGQSTATLLAAAIRTLGFVDLVMAGRSASDTDAGVVPALVAGQMGLALVTPVRSLRVDEAGALVADRLADGGVRRVRITGPAVVGVSNEINKPRSPPLKGVVVAKRAVIPTLTAAELGIERPEPALTLRRLRLPPQPTAKAELIAAESAPDAGRMLADRLRQEGLI